MIMNHSVCEYQADDCSHQLSVKDEKGNNLNICTACEKKCSYRNKNLIVQAIFRVFRSNAEKDKKM